MLFVHVNEMAVNMPKFYSRRVGAPTGGAGRYVCCVILNYSRKELIYLGTHS